MKKQNEVPDGLKWAAYILVGIAVLKWAAPRLLHLLGASKLVVDIKENTGAIVVEEKVKADPGKYTLPSGTVYSVDEADKDAGFILYDLGLSNPAWWPGSWWENDEWVRDRLKTHSRATFTILRSRYDTIYNRDLVKDLTKYLDIGYLNEVKHLWQ